MWLEYIITDDDTKIKNTYLTQNISQMEGKTLEEAYQLIFQSPIGTPTQHIVQSVWLEAFLIFARAKSQTLEQLSLMLFE